MRTAATRILWLVLCGLLPLVALWYAIGPVAFGDRQAADFHFAYYPAAESVLAGDMIYPTNGFVERGADILVIDYVYPPLLALLTVPWTIVPIGLSVGLSPAVVSAMWAGGFCGVFTLPTNGSQIAAANFDETGTTKLGTKLVDHSFIIPVIILGLTTAISGLIIGGIFY